MGPSTKTVLGLMAWSLSPSFAAAEDGDADFAGVKIQDIDRRRGAPVVLLHGGTSNLKSWVTHGVVEKQEKDLRVIAWIRAETG